MQRFSPVFDALNRAGGRYVFVGGVAVNLYGYVRGTTDIDVAIDLAPEDARRSLRALSELGYRLAELERLHGRAGEGEP